MNTPKLVPCIKKKYKRKKSNRKPKKVHFKRKLESVRFITLIRKSRDKVKKEKRKSPSKSVKKEKRKSPSKSDKKEKRKSPQYKDCGKLHKEKR